MNKAEQLIASISEAFPTNECKAGDAVTYKGKSYTIDSVDGDSVTLKDSDGNTVTAKESDLTYN